jgi:hypothetical protein
MDTILGGAILLAVLLLITSIWRDIKAKRQQAMEERIGVGKEHHLRCLQQKVEDLEDQVNHLSRVQLLTLDHLGVEHHIQPQREMLVTIGNLSDLKKSKGRSA